MSRTDIVAVLGPTAAGKSALALELCDRIGGEILCCDSQQVYRGLDIGTAKASADERRRTPHHGLDIVDPGDDFHAGAWVRHAERAIADIRTRGRMPVIAGGTGLYFRALMRGLFEAPPADPEIRARHRGEAATTGTPALHARLRDVDPEAAVRISPNDLVRTSRALEVFEQTGLSQSELWRRRPEPEPGLRAFAIVLDPPAVPLRARIATRVDAMMAAGFLDEVIGLRAAGHGATRALRSLGYRELGAHLDGAIPLDQAVDAIKRNTAQYARRQRTWFKKEPAALVVASPTDLAGIADLADIEHAIARWRAEA